MSKFTKLGIVDITEINFETYSSVKKLFSKHRMSNVLPTYKNFKFQYHMII